MERLAYLWDELDDLLWAARHVLRKSWHGLIDRAPRASPRDADSTLAVAPPANEPADVRSAAV